MKILIALSLFFSQHAFAGSAATTSLTVNPDTPTVVFTDSTDPDDGTAIQAPWFQAELFVNNDQNVTVTMTDIQLDVSGVVGEYLETASWALLENDPIPIDPTYRLAAGIGNFDGLPKVTKGSDLTAVLTVKGYIGTPDHPFVDKLPFALQ